MSIEFIFVIIVYCVCGVLIARQLLGDAGDNKALINGLTAIALAVHCWLAATSLIGESGLNLSTSVMLVVSSAVIVSFYLIGTLTMPIRNLGVLLLPSAALAIIAAKVWSGGDVGSNQNLQQLSDSAKLHILVSVAAYSFLSIAAIQALIYYHQERQIRLRQETALLAALPPLQTMEALLARLVFVGFVFLSATLISGAIFSEQIFGQAFKFNHHTLLAVMGWAVFAVLIFNHWRNGTRGTAAVIFTLVGFGLIQLGYFGTKFVMETIS